MPTEITLTLPSLHSGQREVISNLSRFNVLACGRRFGKTTFGIDRSIEPALKGWPVGWFSPTYKMLSDVWREMCHLLKPVTQRVSSQEKRLELITGGIIDMWSLDSPDVARGRKYARVIIDEAAMIAKLQEAWQAVIRPTLTDFEGDAFFFSTPKGANFFKQCFDWGNDPAYPDWSSWQLPTTANPYIKASEVEAAKKELPERIFLQEYLAVFLDDAGGVFRKVMDAAIATQQEMAIPDHNYVIGCDWGKHNDFTVLSVIDTKTRELVYLDRFNQIDYTLQLARLMVLCDKFKPQSIIAERNAMGEPLIEQLSRQGLPVQPFITTNVSKAEAIDALSLSFEKRDIKILPDSVLIAELQAYEAERLPSGMLRYGAPEGYHDDCVMSLAIAWHSIAMPKWSDIKFLKV